MFLACKSARVEDVYPHRCTITGTTKTAAEKARGSPRRKEMLPCDLGHEEIQDRYASKTATAAAASLGAGERGDKEKPRHRELVDPGAHDNLTGSRWVDRVEDCLTVNCTGENITSKQLTALWTGVPPHWRSHLVLPIPGQISALYDNVAVRGEGPHADFSILSPLGRRIQKLFCV